MAKQTVRLARKALNQLAANARAAQKREKLILDHVHVVHRIARQVQRMMTHVELEDLEQAGFVGLLQAADRFKRTSGVFEHFAYFRVRGAMFDAHKRRAYRDDTLFLDSIDAMFERNGFLPRAIAEDRGPWPDTIAAKREQAQLLAEALSQLPPDERMVFGASLAGISLINTSEKCGKSVAWTRTKLASARAQLGARVHMWGLGLDKAA